MFIANFSLPPSTFTLEHTADALPEIEIEAERIAAHSTQWTMPCLWVKNAAFETIEETFRSDPSIDEIVDSVHYDEVGFYHVEWTETIKERFDIFTDKEGSILEAHLQNGSWRVAFRFTAREQLRTFREYLTDKGHRFQLLGMTLPKTPRQGYYQLTPRQRDALVAAAKNGHFSIPRETTITDLADEFDISHQAFSELLRRGMENLVFSTLTAEERYDR